MENDEDGRRDTFHPFAVEEDLSIGGLCDTGDHIKKGGFTTPRFPEDRYEIPGRDGKIDALQHLMGRARVGVGLLKIFYLNLHRCD